MRYTVRLSLDSYRTRTGFWDSYSALVNVRAVSRRHALDKALAKVPETFWSVYYRRTFRELWTLIPSAHIVTEG